MNRILISIITLLIVFAWWSSLTIGLSTDEYFHHINGLVRYQFLISLGEVQNFKWRNNFIYPGLYDTFSYALGQIVFLISKKFYVNNIDVVMHTINISFSTLSIIGLYLLTKKIFNKRIALITLLLTLLNPFFFGHMGMNPKDIIVCFSFIWFCYYFYLYCVENDNIFKYLILSSFFIGFGCGVRLALLMPVLPVILCGLYYLIKKYRSDYLYLIKRLSLHILLAFFITLFFVILCWPHIIVEIDKGNFFDIISLVIKNTLSLSGGPKIGLINGEFYEIHNTPKSYFLNIFFYRLPFYLSFLLLASYLLFFLKKINTNNEIKNFNINFYLINLIAFFPILVTVILSVNIHDNLRLFLFIIPFFSMIAALSLNYFLETFKNSIKTKTCLLVILILFSLSFYRFILLTPYQYTYVNFSYPTYSKSVDKFEQDYWGATYKELINNLKNQYSVEEVRKFKFADCYGGQETLLYYLNKHFGIKKLYDINERPLQATHIALTNRTFPDVVNNPSTKDIVNQKGEFLLSDLEKVLRSPNVKTTCFKAYSGKDEVVVSRNGAKLSTIRKLD